MKQKIKAYRHGELAFVKTDSVPTLIETKSNVFAKGSEGNSHSLDGLYGLQDVEWVNEW